MEELINVILDAILGHFWENLDEERKKRFKRYVRIGTLWLLLALVGGLIFSGFIS